MRTGVVFIMGHKLYGTVRTPEFGLDRMQEQIVRKTGDFGYKRQVARTDCPKNRRFWVQTLSDKNELSEKQAVLGKKVNHPSYDEG